MDTELLIEDLPIGELPIEEWQPAPPLNPGQHANLPFNEAQLTDEQFKAWQMSPDLRDMRFMEYEYLPPVEGSFGSIEGPRIPNPDKEAKRNWTTFVSAGYGYAVHTDGTLIVRTCAMMIEDRLLAKPPTLVRIDPRGDLLWGSFEGDQRYLASWGLKSSVDDRVRGLRRWVDHAEGREMPTGLKALLKRMRRARESPQALAEAKAAWLRSAADRATPGFTDMAATRIYWAEEP